MYPKIVVASACRCGERCLWDGTVRSKTTQIRELEASGIAVVPICPEMLAGLRCPRSPVRRSRGRVYETDVLTRTRLGRDITHIFEAGAAAALRCAKRAGATEAYLQRFSPSCAPTGITGKLFREHDIKVIPIW